MGIMCGLSLGACLSKEILPVGNYWQKLGIKDYVMLSWCHLNLLRDFSLIGLTHGNCIKGFLDSFLFKIP